MISLQELRSHLEKSLNNDDGSVNDIRHSNIISSCLETYNDDLLLSNSSIDEKILMRRIHVNS
jgi:hypothetical protein